MITLCTGAYNLTGNPVRVKLIDDESAWSESRYKIQVNGHTYRSFPYGEKLRSLKAFTLTIEHKNDSSKILKGLDGGAQ